MLSRYALRALQNQKAPAVCVVRMNSDVAASGERDLVNFPPRVRPIDPSPVRLGIFPAEWFEAFYSKTGVTGPYMALTSIGTFLVSKEFYVIEHDFYVGLGLFIVIGAMVKNIGPSIRAFLDAEVTRKENILRDYRDQEINYFKDAINAEKSAQANGLVWEDVIKAKKEAVGLQLEAAYRARLADAYTQVKKRLDFQLETSNVKRRMEHKHMVDWIINNVRKSITPAQEDAALKKCIADLKALS